MNCKVNGLQAIMLFQCSSHAHHSTPRLSITSQHTPAHHSHCSSLLSTLWATQLQTSVWHHAPRQALLAHLIVAHLMWCCIMLCPQTLCCAMSWVMTCHIMSLHVVSQGWVICRHFPTDHHQPNNNGQLIPVALAVYFVLFHMLRCKVIRLSCVLSYQPTPLVISSPQWQSFF